MHGESLVPQRVESSKERVSGDLLLRQSLDFLKGKIPLYHKTEARLWELGEEYVIFADKLLRVVFDQRGGREGYDQCLGALVRLSLDYIELQAELLKTRKYRFSTYEEVRQQVYDNPAVMGAYYFDGLLLSQVFWVNHYKICEFLLDFASTLRADMKGIEMPCGSGVHSALLLSRTPVRDHTLCDYSEKAIGDATRFVKAYVGEREVRSLRFDARNELPFEDQSLDYVCCGEFVEHLENPAALMTEIRRVLKKDGAVFMTTVAFAAQLDHIYMFESAADIDAFIRDCGFTIRKELILPVSGRDADVTLKQRPLNCAYVLIET